MTTSRGDPLKEALAYPLLYMDLELTIIQTQNRIIGLLDATIAMLQDDIRLKDMTIVLARDELEFTRQLLNTTQR